MVIAIVFIMIINLGFIIYSIRDLRDGDGFLFALSMIAMFIEILIAVRGMH